MKRVRGADECRLFGFAAQFRLSVSEVGVARIHPPYHLPIKVDSDFEGGSAKPAFPASASPLVGTHGCILAVWHGPGIAGVLTDCYRRDW